MMPWEGDAPWASWLFSVEEELERILSAAIFALFLEAGKWMLWLEGQSEGRPDTPLQVGEFREELS